MTLDDLIKVILTAAAAATFTIAVTWLKADRDERRAQADEFNDAILEAADLATEYWLTAGNATNIRQMEARLIGYQQRLSLLAQIAFEAFSDFDRNNLRPDLADFFDACTGGDFKVIGRQVDTGRATEAQAVAAQIAARVRKASLRSAKLGSYLARQLR